MPLIQIRASETYRTRIEDVTEENLFFHHFYAQAQICLKDIVSISCRYNGKKDEKEDDDEYTINPLRLRGYPNNIIAFCAKRGRGKTSAMLSFSSALSKVEGRDKASDKGKKFWGDKILDCRFHVMEPVDPTTLEETDSVIRTIISRMFRSFAEHVQEERGDHDQKKRREQQELLQRFQTCFRLADRQKEKEWHNDGYDDLQQLTLLGDSSNFKEELHNLICSYLKYMNDTKNCEKLFLVIQIDDVDMNTAYAYEVVEDIRKYCVLPNVVILFSVDMFQLEQTVEQYFVKSFDSIIRGAVEENHPSKFTAKFSREQCHKTAVSYLNKLIPGLHRINLPDIDAELRNSAKEIELMTPLSSVGNGEPMAYQEAIKEMLRKKCQVELNDDGFGVHPFVPSRMRELNHFVNRMCSMGDDILFTRQELIKWGAGIDVANVNMEKAQALVSHLEVLLDYFLYVWCELRLDHRERMVIIDIHNAETEDKVYAALESLRRKYSDEKELADLEPNGGWRELMKCTQYLQEHQRRKFACAIELYFQLFRDILLVHDCVRRRENDGHQT